MDCAITNCEHSASINGMCKRHYHRQWRRKRGEGIELPPLGLPETDLAYAAGIIDGEGSIGIACKKPEKSNHSPNHFAHITVGMTDHQVPEWLHETFGGNLRYKPADPPRRAQASWRVSYRLARRFLKAVQPYLKVKNPQAALALQLYDDDCIKVGATATGYAVAEDEIARRDELRIAIGRLNQRTA